MTRYHLDKHGSHVICPAQIRCRAEGVGDGNIEDNHFEGTAEEAKKWAETKNAEINSIVPKPAVKKKSRFSAPKTAEEKEKIQQRAAAREEAMRKQDEERQQRKGTTKTLPVISGSISSSNSKKQLKNQSNQHTQRNTEYKKDAYSPVNQQLETMDSMNPSVSGVFEEYEKAEYRATAPLSDNIADYAETAGVSKDSMVTVYRGVPDDISSINNGDFITTSKELASDYGGNVISMDVPASDILDDKDEPLGDEYIYRIS